MAAIIFKDNYDPRFTYHRSEDTLERDAVNQAVEKRKELNKRLKENPEVLNIIMNRKYRII